MYSEKTKKLNREKGITLIALVITIVILIILASVAINMAFGDSGLIKITEEAKEKSEIATVEEKVQLTVAGSFGDDGNVNIEKLNSDLESIEGLKYKGKPISDNNRIINLPDNVEVDGYYIKIFENGMCERVQKISDYINITVDRNVYVEDEYKNHMIIPNGFKVLVDNSTIYKNPTSPKITEGIVIQDDEGNEFVWVPVGEIYMSEEEKNSVNIILGRYLFSSEGHSNILLNPSASYKEEDSSNPDTILNKGNTIALSIKDFLNSVEKNGGYYIGRYEASYGLDGKVNSKISTGYSSVSAPSEEGMLWNFVTQPEAAIACRNMYENSNYTSDLINGYAWDTAILFIEAIKGEQFSMKNGYNINSSMTNTGNNEEDNILNINDMSGNLREWSTETVLRDDAPCCRRGGTYYGTTGETSTRTYGNTEQALEFIGFRPILYVN